MTKFGFLSFQISLNTMQSYQATLFCSSQRLWKVPLAFWWLAFLNLAVSLFIKPSSLLSHILIISKQRYVTNITYIQPILSISFRRYYFILLLINRRKKAEPWSRQNQRQISAGKKYKACVLIDFISITHLESHILYQQNQTKGKPNN